MNTRAPLRLASRIRTPSYGLTVASLLLTGCVSGGQDRSDGLFGRQGTLWTIRCIELQGPGARQQIERVAESLRRTPGIRSKDVVIWNESDGFERLYYGTYLRKNDRKTRKWSTPRKMRQDLNLIRQLGSDSGTRFFLQAMPVLRPLPDVGNPKWKLANVRAMYSLQVAVFEPTSTLRDYKQAAADFCAYLRTKGYEAYYHHASASSMVTVGAFGPGAIFRKADGRTYYASEVLALQRDELLKHNLVNGAIIRVKTAQGDVPVPSALVEIPHAKAMGR